MCTEGETWLAIAFRYLGTMPGMKPGQVLGHEVRLLHPINSTDREML